MARLIWPVNPLAGRSCLQPSEAADDESPRKSAVRERRARRAIPQTQTIPPEIILRNVFAACCNPNSNNCNCCAQSWSLNGKCDGYVTILIGEKKIASDLRLTRDPSGDGFSLAI